MESEAMNATVSTSHLDFSGKMKERRNGILKKTKYNASLISKIKTKILNNSSMMKISLKNNNKALALALAEEKKKYRMAEQEKVILQKEIYTQNYDIVMLQQRLKTQFQEHQWNGMLFQRSNSVNEDSGSNLNTRLPSGVPPNFRIEEINQASSSQDDKINSLKEAVAVLVDGSTSLMGALACQAFTVNLHENVSINDPNIREHVEVGRPSQDRVSNHTRFSQNFRTSTMYSVPQISLTEQTPETWLSGAMSENQNITLRKKDSCSRSSKISMELMEKNGTSLTRESHSRISNASDISEFNKTSLVVPQVRITPVRYSSQLFDLKRSSTNLFAEKQSDEPWKSEVTIFDAEMDLTTSEAVEIVTVATKSTKHKIKKAKGEKVKVEASSKNVETLRKVKRPKEKNCNIEYLVCKKKQRKHSEEVSVFDQGFVNNNEEPIVGIPNNGPNDWLMHEDSIPNSQEDYRQVVSASKENICNMKGKAEKKTCRVAESVKGSTSNLIVPGARGDYHEVELNEHLNNVEVSSGISNALQDQLDNVKENIGHGTFVVTEKYHSIKESTSNPVIQTKKDYDVEMAEHPDIKDYGNLNNKNTSRRTFVVTEEHKSIRDNTTKSIWQEKPRKHHNIKESTSNPVVQKRTEHDVEMAEHPDIEDYGNLNNKNSSRRTFVVTEEHKSIRDNATKSIGQEKLRNQNIMITDNYQDSSEENIGIKGKANQRVEKLKSVKDNSSKSVGQKKLRKQSVMVTDEYSDNLEEVCRTHDASEENTGNKRKASLRRFVVCKEQKTVKDGSPNSVIWQKGKEQHDVEVAEHPDIKDYANLNNKNTSRRTFVVTEEHKSIRDNTTKSIWQEKPRKHHDIKESTSNPVVQKRTEHDVEMAEHPDIEDYGNLNNKNSSRRTFVVTEEHKSIRDNATKSIGQEKLRNQNIMVTDNYQDSSEENIGIKGKANRRVEKLKSVKDNSSKSVGQKKLRKQSVMVTDEYSDNLEEVCRTHDASEENTGNKRKASLRRFVVCKEQKTVKDGSPNSVIWQKGKEQHEVEVAEHLGNLEICNPNNEDNQKTIVVPKRHKKLSKWEKCREQQEIVIDNLVNIRLDNLEKSNKNSNTIESDISNEKCKADRRTFVISKERKSVKESSSKLTKVEKDEEQYVTAEHFPSTEGSSGTSDTLQDYIKEIADQRTFVANKIPMNVAHSSNLLVEIQDKKQCLTDVNQHLNRFERGSNKSYNQNADISPEDFTNIKKRLDRSIVVYKNIEKDPTQSALPVKKALQYEVKKVQVECEQNTHKILKNDWTSISEKGSKPGRKICINGPSESAPQLPMEDNLATAVRSKVQENKECEVLKDVTNVIPTKLLHQSQLSLRCKRQTTAGLSYKEPSLGRKLRQGDAFTDSRFLHSPVPKTGQKVKKRCGAQNLHK
ncbi:shugoshin 2-like isoform X2 [Scyliorhinus canicula]|uniref:shugoshin 2-like isoform X2 n=1 Tax=Scyliorhinus canicula TaxID=7830 RepID=UPI0018F790E0|nr:shugoshin 2-like isoform X2 [Scyliorhinus canicula]